MDRDFINKYFGAYTYVEQEIQTDDVEFLIKLFRKQFGDEKMNVLEVACGAGRICVPIAKEGHHVTGFDVNEYMLLRCVPHLKDLPNLRIFHADALETDWGRDYDVVIMAGYVLFNLETERDYKGSQIAFIRNAAKALRPGGSLCIQVWLYPDPVAVFHKLRDGKGYFHGTMDDAGTYGEYRAYGSVYDPVTQILAGVNHTELTLSNGEKIVYPYTWRKHFFTQEQLYGWINDAGLSIEETYWNYTDEPVPFPISGSGSATILARKPD